MFDNSTAADTISGIQGMEKNIPERTAEKNPMKKPKGYPHKKPPTKTGI